jgi:hypothetical protein
VNRPPAEKSGRAACRGAARSENVVEKALGDLKEQLNCRRFLISSEASLNGKLFVEFIAVMAKSHMKSRKITREIAQTDSIMNRYGNFTDSVF